MRKVAIIGRSHNTRSDAPFDVPGWEMWALAWDRIPRHDRMFEMHQNWREIDHFRGEEGKRDHLIWLGMQKVPVYMPERVEEIPTSVRYPMEEITALVGKTRDGTPYLESSLAYMMALAILEGVDKIGIWGVDLDIKSEYSHQRPNLEYLIGLARGRGIKVCVPPQSALLTHESGAPYGFVKAEAA